MKRVLPLRHALAALAAFTMACGDSTAPGVTLSEAEVEDMLEAMTAVSFIGQASGSGFFVSRAGQTANATVTLSETVECPNGGSATVSGTATDNPDAGTFSAQITQGFSACAATSEAGRLWTFNGNPNIVTSVQGSFNQSTGAFSLTAAQTGGIRFASDLGEGSCAIDLTLTLTGTTTSASATLSGTACGRTIQRSITVTE
jgi:hypothetical protein